MKLKDSLEVQGQTSGDIARLTPCPTFTFLVSSAFRSYKWFTKVEGIGCVDRARGMQFEVGNRVGAAQSFQVPRGFVDDNLFAVEIYG